MLHASKVDAKKIIERKYQIQITLKIYLENDSKLP